MQDRGQWLEWIYIDILDKTWVFFLLLEDLGLGSLRDLNKELEEFLGKRIERDEND